MTGMDAASARFAARRLRLNTDVRKAAGRAGERRGGGTGASLELRDYRRYTIGDDPRHVDWAAYGRTRDLMVRLFRDEVSPDVDVCIDVSRSMAIDDGRKADLVRELALFVAESARLDGARVRLAAMGERLEWLDENALHFTAPRCALFEQAGRHAAEIRAGGVCVFVSDFLTALSPVNALRELASRAGQTFAFMVLGPWEHHPDGAGALTLIDAETGSELPLHVAARARSHYLRRLDGIRATLRDTCARSGTLFVEIVADDTFDAVLRRDLLPRGAVVPR